MPPSLAMPSLPRLATVFLAASWTKGVMTLRGTAQARLGAPVMGDALTAGWTAEGGRLSLWADRYGAVPLFYAETPQGVLVSNAITALLEAGVSRERDAQALSIRFFYGHFVQAMTPFRAIRALLPGERIVWTAQGKSVSGGAPPRPKPLSLPRAAAIDGYIDLFRAAMAHCLAGLQDYALPLSGGQDSRHILLEAMRQNRPPRYCFTAQPHEPHVVMPDAAIAAGLSARLGLEHVALHYRGDMATSLGKILRLDALSVLHDFALSGLAHLQEKPVDIIDGLAGDILSAGLMSSPHRIALFRDGPFDDFVADHLTRPAMAQLLAPRHRALADYATAHRLLGETFAAYRDYPNPLAAGYFFTRTRRDIALGPFKVYQDPRWRVATPYLYPPLFDFLMGLPPDMFADHRFHAETIAKAFPRFADLPFAGKIWSRKAPLRHRLRDAADLLKLYLPAGQSLSKRHIVLGGAKIALDPHYALNQRWIRDLVLYFAALQAIGVDAPSRAISAS
ncbi:MAG: asparagine synthase-related protein [Pseudomonadota bacterium]